MAEFGTAGRRSVAFGPTLRQRRIEAGLTQEELAHRSGISVRAISDLERNRTARPLMRSVRMLSDALTLSGAAREAFARAAIGDSSDGHPACEQPPGPGGADDRPVPQPLAPWATVPRQLPASVRDFAGRQNELAALNAILAEAMTSAGVMPIVVIGGMAGAGKTTLAIRWASGVGRTFADGQLYVDLGGFSAAGRPVPVADALDGFLHALAIPQHKWPSRAADKAAMFRSVVAGRTILILLDNARDAGQVRPLLPGSASCLTLVTSRGELTGLAATHGAELFRLDLLGPDAALQYLAGRIGLERITADMRAARDLIELCAGLPLALSIAAAQASARPGTPLSEFAAALRAGPGRLDALDAGDPACDVRSVFSWSYNCLDGPAARLFRLLGTHRGPDSGEITAASLAGLANLRPAAVRRLCDQLVDTGLLRDSGGHSYAMHPLVRAYAAEQAAAAQQTAC